MGFFEELGEVLGMVTGGVVGGATSLVGEIVGSDFITEIGKGIYDTSVNAGKTVGQAADGVANIAVGVIESDSLVVEQGFSKIGDAVGKTANGVLNSAAYIGENAINTVDGILSGDNDRILDSAKKLTKVAVVATLAIGVGDYIEGLEDVSVSDDLNLLSDSSDIHDVEPHYVNGYVRDDGIVVDGYWRDGDGDTSVNLTKEDGGGYIRSNPDGILSNNLKK